MGVYYFECGIDGGFEKEHSSGDPRNPCPLCRIAELEAELQTAHEIGARHAKRVGEQALELQALREAAEALVKSGFRVEREDFSTNVDSAKFDALQAALLKEGDDG
jgi:hypothetical protein